MKISQKIKTQRIQREKGFSFCNLIKFDLVEKEKKGTQKLCPYSVEWQKVGSFWIV